MKEFQKITTWLKDERRYQVNKFGIDVDDAHIQEGPDGWFEQQLYNYLGRIKLHGFDTAQGKQAYLKLVATLVGLGESIVRVYGDIPAPGVSSGNIEWETGERIYIAGPMTGLPEKNFPSFFNMEKELKDRGFTVVNPANNEGGGQLEWEDYVRIDLADMLTCTSVIFLPDWLASKGARLEMLVAGQLSMNVFESLEEVDEYRSRVSGQV